MHVAIAPHSGDQPKRRKSPRFILVDAAMHIVCASNDIDPKLLLDDLLHDLAPRCGQSIRSKSVLFETYRDDTIVRIVPLSGKSDGCAILFLEDLGRREQADAAKEFGLTRREAQILPLIVRGATNSAIAALLNLAQSTVGDHVKNIMRKMNTSNRIEVVNKVFHLAEDT
jgi:DNA-binding CsgD family transcriptional regulator